MAGSKSRPAGISPPVDRDQLRLETLPPALANVASRSQYVAGDESHPLPLPLDDQPHGDALHAARRKPRTDLPPQQRRNVVAVQPIDDPPHLLGADEVLVDLAGMLQRLKNRLFRDLVKHQAMDRHLRLQDFAEMPTDRLPFPVFVRRQVQFLALRNSF